MKKVKITYMMLLCIVSIIIIMACSPNKKDAIEWESKDIITEDEGDDKQVDINDYYAGSYYDDEGKLVCCYTGELEKVQEYMHIPAEFKEVKYNINQLNDTYDEYSAHMGDYGITSVGTSHSSNTVIVTLEDLDCIEEMKDKIQGEAVTFELKDPNMEVSFQ